MPALADVEERFVGEFRAAVPLFDGERGQCGEHVHFRENIRRLLQSPGCAGNSFAQGVEEFLFERDCTLLGTKGPVPGSYGAVMTSHLIQVRTAEGSKSKVLFSRAF